jgi:hypothetical protein
MHNAPPSAAAGCTGVTGGVVVDLLDSDNDHSPAPAPGWVLGSSLKQANAAVTVRRSPPRTALSTLQAHCQGPLRSSAADSCTVDGSACVHRVPVPAAIIVHPSQAKCSSRHPVQRAHSTWAGATVPLTSSGSADRPAAHAQQTAVHTRAEDRCGDAVASPFDTELVAAPARGTRVLIEGRYESSRGAVQLGAPELCSRPQVACATAAFASSIDRETNQQRDRLAAWAHQSIEDSDQWRSATVAVTARPQPVVSGAAGVGGASSCGGALGRSAPAPAGVGLNVIACTTHTCSHWPSNMLASWDGDVFTPSSPVAWKHGTRMSLALNEN